MILLSKGTFYYYFLSSMLKSICSVTTWLIANCLLKDDLELEIMINTPPAPSVESLALAHLQDNPQGPTSPPSLRFSPDTKGIFATHSFQLSWRFYFRVLLQKLDSSLDDRSLITNKVVFEIPQFAKHCILSQLSSDILLSNPPSLPPLSLSLCYNAAFAWSRINFSKSKFNHFNYIVQSLKE